jgi:hypothetical protein
VSVRNEFDGSAAAGGRVAETAEKVIVAELGHPHHA